MKVFVLMISKTFMATHPRKGQPTHFKEKIFHGQNANPGVLVITNRRDVHASDISDGGKLHTIRLNYNRWKMISDKVNSGEAILSLRQWTDKPYRSPQVEILQLTKMQVQKIRIHHCDTVVGEGPVLTAAILGDNSITPLNVTQVALNDGFSDPYDFYNWFKKDFDGCIIHFTSFKY